MSTSSLRREFDKVEVGAYYRTLQPWNCDDHDWCVKIIYTVNTKTISSTSTVIIDRAGDQSYDNWINFIEGSERLLDKDGNVVCSANGTYATQYVFDTNIPDSNGTIYSGGITIPIDILRKPLRSVIENVRGLKFKFREE